MVLKKQVAAAVACTFGLMLMASAFGLAGNAGEAVRTLGRIVNHAVAQAAVSAAIATELTLGVVLVFIVQMRGGALLFAAGLLSAYAGYLGLLELSGIDLPCGCGLSKVIGSSSGNHGAGIAVNLLMAALAVVGFRITTTTKQSGERAGDTAPL